MNNLIIGTPRSGTFNLFNSITANPGHNGLSEPFNGLNNNFAPWKEYKKGIPKTLELNNNNYTLKTICAQYPIDINEESMLDYYKELISYFDNVKLLDRRDVSDHFKSWCNLRHKMETSGADTVNKRYVWNDSLINLDHLEIFVYFKHVFFKLVEEFKFKVFYYEDLFFNCQEETYKEMNLKYTEAAKTYLHPDKRYRQEKKSDFLL